MSAAFDAKSVSELVTGGAASMSGTPITVGSGSNRALLVLVSWTNATLPTGVSVTWDNGGTNQAMTLVSGTQVSNSGEPCTQALYGLINPTSGAKTLNITWTGLIEARAMAVSFTSVDQTSVAVAFPHGNTVSATATSGALSITSATGNMVAAIYSEGATAFTANSGTIIINSESTGTLGSRGLYDNGAASVNTTCSWNGVSTAYVGSGCDVLAAATSSLVLGWRRSVDDFPPKPTVFQADAGPSTFLRRSLVPVPTRWPLPTGADIEHPFPILRSRDEPPGPWFVRSPNPVPTAWPPATGADRERLPPIPRAPDEPPGPFFARSPVPVPTLRRLPTTGDEYRIPPIARAPDEPPAFFARSPSPVPARWLPTAGETEHPVPVRRAPDEPPGPFFTRSPSPVPTRWPPTTGRDIERLPPIGRSPDESFPFFVRSRVPVPTILWFAPWDQPRLNVNVNIEQAAFIRAPAVAASTISGIAWFSPSVERLPPIGRSPDEATPFFVRSPSPVPRFWLPNTGAEDRPAAPAADQYAAWQPPQLALLTTFIAQANADDFNPLPLVRRSLDEPPVSTFFVRSPSPVPRFWLPNTGAEDRPRAARYLDTTPWAPQQLVALTTFMAQANADDFNPLPLVRRSPDESPAFFKRAAVAVVPISGISWRHADDDTRPALPPADTAWWPRQYVVYAQIIAQANADDFNPLPLVANTADQRWSPTWVPQVIVQVAQTEFPHNLQWFCQMGPLKAF